MVPTPVTKGPNCPRIGRNRTYSEARTVRCGPRLPEKGSGGLDRRDLELQGDLVADQDAAGLERGVPGDAPVLAVDDQRTLEADALVAERVDRRALEGEVHGHRAADALDREVAGDADEVVRDGGDGGGDERDLRVVGDVEEVVAAQVAVTLFVAGVDAVDLDHDARAGPGEVLGVDL